MPGVADQPGDRGGVDDRAARPAAASPAARGAGRGTRLSTLTPITASNIASSYSAVGASLPSMPALLKKQSMRAVGVERRLYVSSARRPILVTSAVDRKRASPPCWRMMPTVASPLRRRGRPLRPWRPLPRERHGRRAADAVTAAGDQRDLAGEIHFRPPSDDPRRLSPARSPVRAFA